MAKKRVPLLKRHRFSAGGFLLCVLVFAGCTTRGSQNSSALLGEPPDFGSMKSFQQLVGTSAGTKEYQEGRIDYLFERLRHSPYNFVRNNQMYSNARAVAHLRWKYLRYEKEAPTAESFIDFIASSSRASGKPYLIKISASESLPVNRVLHNELDLLDGELQAYHDTLEKGESAAKEKNETISDSKNLVVDKEKSQHVVNLTL